MYPQAIRLKRHAQPVQAEGMVVTCDKDGIRVSSDAGDFLARRALSCLMEPEIGDRVLVAGDAERTVYVIAVLERNGGSAMKLSVDRDLAVDIPGGILGITAGKGVHLVSAGDMSFTSSDLTINAPRGRVFLDSLSYIGSSIFARTGAVKLVGALLDAVFERISHTAKRSYRVVEEVDQVRSGHMDYRAEENMRLRARNTLVSADELVKFDGDQIHLG